jgi:hypothetical protein
MRIRAAIAVALVAITSVATAPLVAASPVAERPKPEHCSITIIGQKSSGELVTTTPRCFESAQAAAAYLPQEAPSALQNVLAIHYKQTGYTGPSLTVNGGSCTGGYINLQGSLASWRNAIVSTRNVFCSVTRHWSGFNKTGAVDVHFAWEVNLGSLIGNTSSASYHNA